MFQVEYAQEAVKKGSTAVGLRGDGIVVLGVEKRSVPKLQDERTVRKVRKGNKKEGEFDSLTRTNPIDSQSY